MEELINKQYSKVDERSNQQLQLIEHILNALLTGISPQDLTTSQRLNFATKMLSPYVRMLALQYTIQRSQQSATEEDALLADLRQRLRLSLEAVIDDAPPSYNHKNL